MSEMVPFAYGDAQVRVVTIDGEPWFVLSDLCKVLDIANPSNVAARLDEGVRQTHTLRHAEGMRGNPNVTIVSEPACTKSSSAPTSLRPPGSGADHRRGASRHPQDRIVRTAGTLRP
ncbi:hypothetical protein GS924_06710 [Rhodococcus hoagii]|nr:hypothetical protein [Prescottella equi]